MGFEQSLDVRGTGDLDVVAGLLDVDAIERFEDGVAGEVHTLSDACDDGFGE